ncbi:hypothetical protein GQ457_02G016140 [Hibiscus cannabinus]
MNQSINKSKTNNKVVESTQVQEFELESVEKRGLRAAGPVLLINWTRSPLVRFGSCTRLPDPTPKMVRPFSLSHLQAEPSALIFSKWETIPKQNPSRRSS